ncbi:MAG: acyltransferase family protein, partial [Pseudomonadota bacterium]
ARSDSLPELVQSLLFLPFDNDGQGHVPVLFVGWTLNYEMLFYTLFALALALGARIAGTALMIGAVVLTCMALAPAIPIFALEAWASPILFEFVFGMAIWAFLSGQGSAYQMSVMTSMIVLCIGLCAMTESWRAVTSGLPAAILVWAALRWFGTVRLPGAITILGGASYALYLTHAFVIGAVERTSGPLDNLAMAAGVSVICVAVSLAVYFWVERPMNQLANTPRTSPGLHP